ncbi:MAG: helix-turn-helix transcriptional regulator [Alphaproteobacteria bacterium]|nr:helix-turn-helix transcriptional regulator [Alphaproteobacteria bacterium]
MDVNANTIRDMRRSRGWTQQHLADACEISLRTVQRVEKDGSAAHETVQGLCAVFSVSPEVLLADQPDSRGELTTGRMIGSRLIMVATAMAGGLVGALVTYLLVAP